jgi:curved DNA-binding protein
MKYIDYYEVLNVAKTATEKEIKQAYRKLARQHHPDLHQGEAKIKAEEKIKLINEAYEVLGDEEKRGKYDKLGMNWKTGEEFNGGAGGPGGYAYQSQGQADFDPSMFGFSDFFANMFGQDFARSRQEGGRGRRTNYKGEDVDAEISLSVEEFIHGVEKEIYLSSPSVCGACAGQRFTQRGVCQACGGTGVSEETKTIKVKIPEGRIPGSSIRLKGLGGKGLGDGPAGDLYLSLKAKTDSTWKITGSDLETDLVIYPDQAVLGDKIQVPTPHGPVQLKIHPGMHSGQRLRLQNRGLPKANGSGDLYLRISLDLPANLPEEAQELYRKLRELRQKEPTS